MKKLSVFIAAALLLAALGAFNVFGQSGVGGYPRNPKFGNVAVTGSVTSTKACASGYTRAGPNLCTRDAWGTGTGLTRDACTTIAAPAGAKAVLFYIEAGVVSTNVVGLRFVIVDAFDSSACSTGAWRVLGAQVREQVAVAATTLGIHQVQGLAKVFGGNVFLKFTDDAGNNGIAAYHIIGYHD